jgi:glycosyltransferase involved in cell wall biosynthesis
MRSINKLVILVPGFATDEQETTAFPSLQLFLNNLLKEYPGIKISVIAFHYPFAERHYNWKGMDVYSAGGNKWKTGKLRTWYRVLKHLFRIRKTSGIDIVHAFWLADTALIGIFFRFITGTPLLLTAMGQDVKSQNRYLKVLPLKNVSVTFLSGFQLDYNPSLSLKCKSRIIPFGIDPEFHNEQLSARTTDIIGVGSLNAIKNYPDFIDIVHAVSNVIPHLRCRIVGKGSELKRIKDLLLETKTAEIITLTGELQYEQAIREMSGAKILLHTSVFEGQGLVITEALASGAYVVSYPIGIAKDLKCKKLIVAETKAELIKTLISILQKEDPDYSGEVFYTIRETCKSYMEIYNTIN